MEDAIGEQVCVPETQEDLRAIWIVDESCDAMRWAGPLRFRLDTSYLDKHRISIIIPPQLAQSSITYANAITQGVGWRSESGPARDQKTTTVCNLSSPSLISPFNILNSCIGRFNYPSYLPSPQVKCLGRPFRPAIPSTMHNEQAPARRVPRSRWLSAARAYQSQRPAAHQRPSLSHA